MKALNLIFREQDKNSFERIKQGEKLIETRAGLPEYLAVAVGDELVITCDDDTITKTVKEVCHFKNIEELLENIPLENIMPKGTTREQAIAKWNSFPGYPERIKEYGIIAWKL